MMAGIRIKIATCVAILMIFLCCFSITAAGDLRAGAATSNITPPLDVSTAGSMSPHTATHIHDELHARCLVLDDGDTYIGIVLADVCVLPREVVDEAKKRIESVCSITPEHMLIAATHTHSAPTTAPLFQNDPDPAYLPFLISRIVDGVRCAVNRLSPARIAFGSASLPEQVFNRRWYMKPEGIAEDPFGNRNDKVRMNPPRASEFLIDNAGPTDPEIAFIALETDSGQPLALLANYSLHYVGGNDSRHVSADYFGIFADRIQQLLGADRLDPPFVGMLSNGTSGDINNIDFGIPAVKQAPYEQMQLVGNAVAEKVSAAYPSLEWRESIKLAGIIEEISIGVRLPDQKDVLRAREILASADGNTLTGFAEIYARETVLLSEYPEQVPLVIQAMRIGDLGIAAIPCEAFAEIGLAIKGESPFPRTFTIELANGYNGYLPTPEQHALGGYETWRARSSYLEENASETISKTVKKLFQQLNSYDSTSLP